MCKTLVSICDESSKAKHQAPQLINLGEFPLRQCKSDVSAKL